jgi:hypothetical protein
MAAGITGLTQTAVAALVPSASEPVLESKWHQPFSEPVRQRIAPQLAVALIASGLTYVNAGPFPESVTEGRWHQPWSEPVRVRPALPAGEHLVSPFDEDVVFADRWFIPLSEPVRVKPALLAGSQQFLSPDPFPKVSFSWWNWLAEPVRVRGVRVSVMCRDLDDLLTLSRAWRCAPAPRDRSRSNPASASGPRTSATRCSRASPRRCSTLRPS